jgi:hypothetical protein
MGRESTLELARRLRCNDQLLFALWSLTTLAALVAHAVGGALIGITLFGSAFGVVVDPVAVLHGVVDLYETVL